MQAIIYARYSPRPKRGGRNKSIAEADALKNSCDVQIADLQRYCDERGYRWSDALTFRDDAKSGKSLKKRRGLRKAFDAARGGMVFVCRDTKRLARNMLDAFLLVRRLTRRKVRFETFVEGAFDVTDSGKFGLFGIRAVMAEMERLNTSKVTKAKMLRHQYEGHRRMSNRLPYGFEHDPTSERLPGADGELGAPMGLRVSASEREDIALIVDLYANHGLSCQAIAETMNERGRLCRGAPWWPATVWSILKRENVTLRKRGPKVMA